MTCLSLFSGILGLDLACEIAGFETVGYVEWDKDCQRAIKDLRPGVPIWGDIREFNREAFRRATGRDSVDLVVGGPPCQPFSSAGKRQGADDERDMWPEFVRVVDELQPRWFLAENVEGLVQRPGAPFHSRYVAGLAVLGCFASDGECWALTKPVDVRCKATASSQSESALGAAWPRPRADKNTPQEREDFTPNLASRAQNWPRPSVGSGDPTTAQTFASHGLDLPMASLMWRRPDTGAGGTSGLLSEGKTHRESGQPITIRLADEAKNWPRPLVRDTKGAKDADGKTGSPNLPTTAVTWARPDRAPDAPNMGSNSTQIPGLGNQAAAFSRLLGQVVRATGETSELSTALSGQPLPETKKLRLNWRFVEWLMGFPNLWLALPWLTRAKRLKMLGNAVNPFQALPFLEAIAEDIRNEDGSA